MLESAQDEWLIVLLVSVLDATAYFCGSILWKK